VPTLAEPAREVTVPGLHFLPEDSAELIGTALADWLPNPASTNRPGTR
jgi:hypothetical protein